MLAATARIYKNAYSGLSKETWFLSLVMLINRSGTMVVPFMSLYATEHLHMKVSQAGIIMASFGAGSIAGAYFGGRITDQFGFYRLQLFALLSGGVMFITVGYITQFLPLCIATFILSMCNESFRPANSTAIAHYSKPENRTRSYALNRLAINFGWAVGGALGGFLAGWNYKLLFWVDGITNLSAAVIMIALLPMVKKEIKPESHHKDFIRTSPYKDKVYMLFIVLTVLFAMCFMQLFGMQVVFFKRDWHISEQMIGILMATNGLLIAFVEMVLVFYLEKRRAYLQYIQFGFLLTGVGFAMVNILPPVFSSAVTATFIITVGEMFALPFMNTYWIGRTTNDNRGAYAGLYTMAWSTAHVIAPTFGSQVAENASFTLLWWIIGAICVISSFGVLYLRRKTIS